MSDFNVTYSAAIRLLEASKRVIPSGGRGIEPGEVLPRELREELVESARS